MNHEYLIIGKESGRFRRARLPSMRVYTIWVQHYYNHLVNLYEIFVEQCKKNDVDWNEKIDLETFIQFVYNRSSKYLSPWS